MSRAAELTRGSQTGYDERNLYTVYPSASSKPDEKRNECRVDQAHDKAQLSTADYTVYRRAIYKAGRQSALVDLK